MFSDGEVRDELAVLLVSGGTIAVRMVVIEAQMCRVVLAFVLQDAVRL